MITAALTLASSLVVGELCLLEDNDTPFSANLLGGVNLAVSATQTHDFDASGDVDWVLLDLVPGFWEISVIETLPPVSGSLDLVVAVYGEAILTDPMAAPLGVLSSCPGPAVVMDVTVTFPDQALYFVKVEECQGRTSGEYDVILSPVKLDSPFDPVLIMGNVVLTGTATPAPGLFVLSDDNSSTVSSGSGAFSLSVNSFTAVLLSVTSPDFMSSVEFVPAQAPGATVSNVTIQVSTVLGELVFASSFETGE